MPKILVVEDDEAILKAVKTKLANSEFEVLEAKDGKAGLACLFRKPDLIWLDIYMPRLDGFEFLAALKTDNSYAAYRNIPVVVVTASHGAYDDVRSKFNSQVKGYFVKSDVSLEKIVDKVRQVLSPAS